MKSREVGVCIGAGAIVGFVLNVLLSNEHSLSDLAHAAACGAIVGGFGAAMSS